MGIGLSGSRFGVESNIDLCFHQESPNTSVAGEVIVAYCAYTSVGVAVQADDAVDTLSDFPRLWVVAVGKCFEAYGFIAYDEWRATSCDQFCSVVWTVR